MTEPEEQPVVLRVLVGSRAHGVADDDADYDYREVFYVPTKDLLSVPRARRPKKAWQAEHRATDDEGGWEVEQFLEMCLRGHPNALELLAAPVESETEDGRSLRALLPQMLAARTVAGSFLGYSKNTRGKMVDREQAVRQPKWAGTYLRVLWTGATLCATGTLHVEIDSEDIRRTVVRARSGALSPGLALSLAEGWEEYLLKVRRGLGETVLPEEPDYAAVNDWLLAFRKAHWDA